jgi:hypothetical protein
MLSLKHVIESRSHQESQRNQLADNLTPKGKGAKSEGWTMRAKAKLLGSPSIIQIGDPMANELKKQQEIYDALRGQLSARLMRATGIAEVDVANLSLGEIINTLFLMHGDCGSTGNFNVSFGAAMKMVGADLMWLEPPPNNVAAVEPEQRVN